MPGSQQVHLPKRETGRRWRDEAEEVIEIVGRYIEGSFFVFLLYVNQLFQIALHKPLI